MATAHDSSYRNDHYNGPYPNASYHDYDRGYGYRQPSVDWNSGYYRGGFAGERYRDNNYYRGDGYYYSQRSPGKSAAIVGGTAAAGAIFGALAGGGKGAAIGAAVGGVGGLIFDQAIKDHDQH
jgi:hypothetical protein